MNLILFGFMGTGKTAVGLTLARELQRRFIDVDALIVEQEGSSIAELFAKKGEAAFRRVESQVIREVAAERNAVIAVGGGAILDPENVKWLKQDAILVRLAADPQTVLDRVEEPGAPERPLLSGEPDKRQRIETLMQQRETIYRSTADVTIDTTTRSIREVVYEIIQSVKGQL